MRHATFRARGRRVSSEPCRPLRIALAQLAPRLGALDENLARHHEVLAEARAERRGPGRLPRAGADRLPAPGPRGRGRDAARRPAAGHARAQRPRAVGGRVVRRGIGRSPAVHRRRAASRTARSGTSTESCSCPTYGLFDERRFFAAGDVLRAVPSRLGVGLGIAVCEDFWHLAVPQLLALDGAQILVNVSSSPGRDLAATNEVGLGTATSWRTLMRTYAQLTTSFVVFCNRVGRRRVDLVLGRLGGHRARPASRSSGAALRRGPVHRSTSTSATCGASGSRCRCCATSGPSSRCASWSGSSPSEPGCRLDRDRSTGGCDGVAAASRARPAIAVRAGGPMTRDDEADLFELPAGAADRHRRGPPGHRRVHPRPAAPGRLRAGGARRCPAASTRRSWPTSSPRRSAPTGCCACSCRIGRRRRRRAAMRRTVVRRARAAPSELVEITPMVDGYFVADGVPGAAGPSGLDATALRRGNFTARMRMAVALRPIGDLGRARRRHGQQDRVADRLHDALRRQRLAPSTRSATCTRARSASLPPRSACPSRSSGRRHRPTCGRARPTRARAGSATRCSIGCCSGGSTSGARSRSWSRSGFEPGHGRAGRPPGRGLGVQAPGAADRQARAADGRRRLPVPATAPRLGPD